MQAAFERLGFSADAAEAMVDQQGIDGVEELALLDDKGCEALCKAVKRPGGMIPNPNAGARNAPAVIPNPGVLISIRSEELLKLAAYWLRHMQNVSRIVGVADIQLVTVREIREHRRSEDKHENPTSHPKINAKDWPKTMELMHEHLYTFLGETGIPLAYVVCAERVVPADPDPAEGYGTRQREMMFRAPHQDAAGTLLPVYRADNEKVFEIIAAMTRDQPCWTQVKPAQRGRDGRAAYWELYNFFLGPNRVNLAAAMAEKKLEDNVYTGQRRRQTFDTYVKVELDQHAILEGLVEHSCAGIDECSKVRYLMMGVKPEALNSVKTRIMSEPEMQTDFSRCVGLFKSFIDA